jgi:probable phosphoglycerate mutase
MTTNVYIIRHGEARCNVDGIVGGLRGCQGLTERGHEQVALLAGRLRAGEIKADVIYGSTFRRARETAEGVAGALERPIEWDDAFQEIRPGEADGLTYADARERFHIPGRDPVYEPLSPDGESWSAFFGRVGQAFTRVLRQHEGRNIVIAAHGGIIEASFYYFLGMPVSVVRNTSFWVHHTSITQWRQGGPAHDQRWYLVRYNDVAHLDPQMLASTEPL